MFVEGLVVLSGHDVLQQILRPDRAADRGKHTPVRALQNPLRLPALKDREYSKNISHTRGVSSVAVNETYRYC